MNDKSSSIRKVGIAILGGAVLLIGIVTIPYPGPGWLIVFAGLGILSTEFEWAKRVLRFARGKYDAWQEWLKRQNFFLKAAIYVLTGLVVIMTIYLLNGYGLINDLLDLKQDWLKSPLV